MVFHIWLYVLLGNLILLLLFFLYNKENRNSNFFVNLNSEKSFSIQGRPSNWVTWRSPKMKADEMLQESSPPTKKTAGRVQIQTRKREEWKQPAAWRRNTYSRAGNWKQSPARRDRGTQHKGPSALLTEVSLLPSVPNQGSINWVSPADANVRVFQDTSFLWLVSEISLL